MLNIYIETTGIILAAWIWLGLCFVGVGLGVRSLFMQGNHEAARQSVLDCFWIGFGASLIFLQTWHFFFKASGIPLIVLSMVAIVNILIFRAVLFKNLMAFVQNQPVLSAFLILTGIWVANGSLGPPESYDSGLYHLNTVRFSAEYPIVPGLALINSRLAFNAGTFFLYPAMLEFGPLLNKSHHIINGLFIFITLAQLINHFFTNKNKPYYIHHRVALLFIPVVFYLFLNANIPISNPTPDFAVFLIGILITLKLLMLLENNTADNTQIYTIIFLIMIGCLVKSGFMLFGFVSLGVVLLIKRNKNIYRYMIILFILSAVPWMIRNIILSGYPFFPKPWFGFDVDWRVPAASAMNLNNWLESWILMPNVPWQEVLGKWDWVGGWLKRNLSMYPFYFQMPLFIFCVSAFIFACCHFFGRAYDFTKRKVWLIIIIALITLVLWLVTIPEPRYAGALFWILALTTLVLSVDENKHLNDKQKSIIFISVSFALMLNVVINNKDWSIRQTFDPTPTVEYREFKTNDGTLLYVPINSEQCWDGLLPCTPHPHPAIALRKENDLRYGFKMEPFDDEDSGLGIHVGLFKK